MIHALTTLALLVATPDTITLGPPNAIGTHSDASHGETLETRVCAIAREFSGLSVSRRIVLFLTVPGGMKSPPPIYCAPLGEPKGDQTLADMSIILRWRQ
jgi:hypothetical protein